jgi:4-diphosphocytidyl-2-C-methyl-D-erythritol kinase
MSGAGALNDFGAHESAPGEWTVHAPAKVNLWLKIHRKRPDGYHDLSTVMLALDLQDKLRGERTNSGSIELRVVGPQATADIPEDERNLVWKTLALLRDVAVERGGPAVPGLKIELEKHIPSQAGMGGGSSDAAAALVLGERLLGIDAGAEWKRAALARLGADCSFFQEVGSSGLALCEGIGDAVKPWEGTAPSWHVLYVVPEVACPTGPVFSALPNSSRVAGALPFGAAEEVGALALAQLRGGCVTDLEPAALDAVPILRDWRELFDSKGLGHMQLSGSGSAFFGLYESNDSAHSDLAALIGAIEEKGWEQRAIGVARPLGR